jgi:molybdopterin-guanine dinucleotide biosynthesis protein A
MVAKDQLTLAILAGGRGMRLGGVDKGGLVYQGRTLLDRLLDLKSLCAEALVIREDVVPGKGAPGGVVTALTRAQTPHVLIVCCDMPFVTPEAVRPLLYRPPACFEGQPFPGVYPTVLAAPWRLRLAEDPSMSELVSGFHQVPASDGRVVRSINTVEDAKSLGVDIP